MTIMAGNPLRVAMKAFATGFLLWGAGVGQGSAQNANSLPEYLSSITGSITPSPAELATRDVLQLNATMFTLYDNAARTIRRNIMARHPVILALFSGTGGRMILYRPGQPPQDAPQVPIVYQVMKSTGHSVLAISQVVVPYIGNEADKSWMTPLLSYRIQMKAALDGVDLLPIQPDWKPALKNILGNNVAYMDDCLSKGVINLADLQSFAAKQSADVKRIINWAASTQVKHWMSVLDDWKAALGTDFDKTYAAANTIYVARQNNVLFSVLAQYFGPDAINDRLMLIETISFTTTPEEMLTSLTRIIADRTVGELFFGNYKLMDFELMGGDARKTIVSEMKTRGKDAFLPPWVPFGSKQWPALVTPGPGPSSLDDLK